MVNNATAVAQKPPLTNRGVKCAENEISKPVETPACLVLDMVTMSVKLPTEKVKATDYEPTGFLFSYELQPSPTKLFKKLYKIQTCFSGEWVEFGSMETDAHVSFIPKETAIIKISNEQLYHARTKEMVQLLLAELGATFNHFTRLDVSMDFHQLHYKSMLPELFIRNYAAGKYRMKGRKINRVVEQPNEIDEQFFDDIPNPDKTGKKRPAYIEFKRAGQTYTSVTWGSYASGIRINMYNKTLEQKQRVRKPWIWETWEKNGLNVDATVWRLEFQIKKDAFAVIYPETGEAVDMTCISMLDRENWQSLFHVMYDKHFVFAKADKNQPQFCRLKKIDLFILPKQSVQLETVSKKKKSSNMHKYFIKRMVSLKPEYLGTSTADHLQEIIQNEVEKYDLKKWFDNQFPNEQYDNNRSALYGWVDMPEHDLTKEKLRQTLKDIGRIN